MRRPRFPFLIGPPRAPTGSANHADPLSRALRSLSLIESSLEELLAKTDQDTAWREFFGALVPILDGISGLRAAVEESGDTVWRRGMEMLTAKLDTLLSSRGLERSARVGGTFDPLLHRAAGARRVPGLPPGGIAEVVLEGWTLKGSVVRPAMVIVCREDT